ncbi:alpha/beta hydrolase family protein [Kitasatospora viridis]|uniref:Platelet-activating factor acetylhydrolase isoform II n=1 Tax=Kitasatospora viridis TaxID=281105 RepID=A0A561UBR6_9ACTN|nr:alpha/beta hydrolase [Kitasatospora viridis]TWF96786.1 platelet-activating factor acetylhydrolase isoform II [Kitasatospora viridis]
MITPRRAAVAAALVLALVSPLSAASTAFAAGPGPAGIPVAGTTASVAVALPRPTGPHAVGRSVLDLVDQQRTDPWVPSAGPRQLMVSVFYPARPGTGSGPAPYMTQPEAHALLAGAAPAGTPIPPGPVPLPAGWAAEDAKPAPGKYPLVLLSPGFNLSRATLTGLAEDLASRGYVVALVDHTYESFGVTFPDGRTLPAEILDNPPPHGWADVELSRAKDMSFVIDQLTGPHPAWPYAARLIDRHRIGMAGHSLGGSSAATTMAADPRVLAGVNLDGSFQQEAPAAGVGDRPFLMLGTQAAESPGMDVSWTKAWAQLDGWKRWLTVSGFTHPSFTDEPLLAAALGVPMRGDTTPPQREAQITRAYVAAFFDLQLKGIPQPLLDGPSAAYPEVAFQH